jgi:predicted DNA-binding protein
MAVQLPIEVESKLDALALTTGESMDDLLREAVLSYLEDRHLAAIAEERLKDIGERTSLADIGREFDLVD